jgi:hypothetical protein
MSSAGSTIKRAVGSVTDAAKKLKSNDLVDAAGSILTSQANVATLGAASRLQGGGAYTGADLGKDLLNGGAPGSVPLPGTGATTGLGWLHQRAITDPRRSTEKAMEQADAQAQAAYKYSQSLIPQSADLTEIRRQRAAQYKRNAVAGGTNLGTTNAGAKTLLGL